MQFEDFLSCEDRNNVDNTVTFKRFLKRAVGPEVEVIVAHHIVFVAPGQPPNEIPSADTLYFSPQLMTAVFGTEAKMVMGILAARTPDLRAKVLNDYLQMLDDREAGGGAKA